MTSARAVGGRMRYIGDLSREDAALLARYAGAARRILEFGSGASTQVFAQAAAAEAEIVSVETDPAWIARTRANLARLGLTRAVRFVRWRDFRAADESPFDLIFNDGVDRLRRKAAARAWPLLAVGGHLLFHDTRRIKDAKNALEIAEAHFLEVESIQLNEASSNVTAIRRKRPEPWVDWNVAEGRARWEYGHAEPPPGLWSPTSTSTKTQSSTKT